MDYRPSDDSYPSFISLFSVVDGPLAGKEVIITGPRKTEHKFSRRSLYSSVVYPVAILSEQEKGSGIVKFIQNDKEVRECDLRPISPDREKELQNYGLVCIVSEGVSTQDKVR